MESKEKPWPCIKCRVMMKGITADYCKCPICGTEVWYNYEEGAEQPEAIDEIMRIPSGQMAGPDFSILSGPPAKGGGGSGGRNKRNQLMKKLPCAEIYKRMCGENKLVDNSERPVV